MKTKEMSVFGEPLKIHLMGIGGIGMTALAGLFKEKGFDVQGSDNGKIYSPAKETLEKLNVKVFEGYHPNNITSDIHEVIVGNVISKGNIEMEEVLRQKIPFTSMAQSFKKYFLEGKQSIVISGTHGKTTTSTLMAHTLKTAGLDPGFFIGGIPNNFEHAYSLGLGDYFVFEGDEYDTAYFEKTPKFLHYNPHHVVITSIEFDHADIYNNLDEIKAQFVALLRQKPKEGVCVVHMEDKNVSDVVNQAGVSPVGYGMTYTQGVHIKKLGFTQEFQNVQIFYQNKEIMALQTPLMGDHNLLNMLAVVAMALELGLDQEKIKQAQKTFLGVRRRQEKIGEAKNILIYDDFAHHPTAVFETLKGFLPLTQSRGGKLWAIFEPRSNTSRRKVFQKDWPRALSAADKVILAPVFVKQDALKQEDQLDIDQVIADLKQKNVWAQAPQTFEEILSMVRSEAKPGDVVVLMSNGAFGGLPRLMLESLS